MAKYTPMHTRTPMIMIAEDVFMPFNQPDSYQHCGAKTRNGTPCKAPKVNGRNRCRMHGGSTPRGAQLPQFRHGFYSQDAQVQQFWKAVNRVYQENLRNERQARFLEANPLPCWQDYKSERAYRKAVDSWKARYLSAIRRRDTDIVLAEDAMGIYQAYCSELGTDDFLTVYLYAMFGFIAQK